MRPDLDQFRERALRAARAATSEADLQGRLDHLLRELLALFDVAYEPLVNVSLARAGLSEVSTDRPDSMFGHVVLDYKDPGILGTRVAQARTQIEGYLNDVTDGGPCESPDQARRWAGVLWDGFHLTYCQLAGTAWRWSQLHPTSVQTLRTLVHLYRSLQRKPLTAPLLSRAFGKDSPIARELIPLLCLRLQSPHQRTAMLFQEWGRLFEQVSTYGLDQLPSLRAWAVELGITCQDASIILFATHTYYSLVVKLLAAELLTAAHGLSSTSLADAIANAPDDDALYARVAAIEDSALYRRFRVLNFLEGDFFSWYASERQPAIAQALRALARELLDFEPGTAIINPHSIRDLLKQFYTALVDEQIRHDLGEYYTPDWLAEHVLNCAGYQGQETARLLDPACGSGTFLVEAISRLRQTCARANYSPAETLRTIVANVKGMDLNPLAVISARANYILSIADLIFAVGDDIELPIYLADCINVPVAAQADDGLPVLLYRLDTQLGVFDLEIPEVLVREGVMGLVLSACDQQVGRFGDPGSFIASLQQHPDVSPHLTPQVSERLASLFAAISHLEARDWDRVWCRIVQNSFSPRGFGDVDYIVGNPPWVRWSRLPQSYRTRVKGFCRHYGLVSGRGYTGGIESDIATVVTYSAVDNWLAVGGTVAFLVTVHGFSVKAAGVRGQADR